MAHDHPLGPSIIGGFHALAIALFGGMLVMTDLRLLG